MRQNYKDKLNLEQILNLISEGKTLSEIGVLIQVPPQRLSYFLIKNGVRIKKVNPYNSNFFKDINSELKAYILGYIIADGCITIEERNNRPSTINRVQFQTAESDLQVISLIRDVIAPSNKISFVESKKSNRQNTIKLRLANKEIVKDLIELYNIKPRKTFDFNFKFPSIPEELKRHLIRGYFDGDGSVGKRHFSFIFNSKYFLQEVLDCFLKEIPDLKYYIYEENRSKTTYYSLHFSVNKKSRVDLYNFLYKDSTYKLERKSSKFLNTVLNSKSKDLLSV